MVHEATGLWHGAGFSVSRWLMIIIHGYRATTLLLSILLNVLVRTAGEYRYDTVLGFLATFVSLSTTSRPPLSLSLSSVCVSLDGTVSSFCPRRRIHSALHSARNRRFAEVKVIQGLSHTYYHYHRHHHHHVRSRPSWLEFSFEMPTIITFIDPPIPSQARTIAAISLYHRANNIPVRFDLDQS